MIRHLSDQGCKQICLMGGEPLLHPDIDILIEYILHRNMLCDITTNGLLVTRKIETLKKVDGVMLSLDGSEKHHNANRQNWPKVMDGLLTLRENNIPFRINAVMTKQTANIDNIMWLLRLSVPVTFSLAAEFPQERKDLEQGILLGDMEIQNLFYVLRALKKEGYPVMYSLEGLQYMIDYPHTYRGYQKEGEHYHKRCMFGRQMIYIDAQGLVYPCATLWNVPEFKPKMFGEEMQALPCKYCSCIGVPEWERASSLRGIIDGVKLTVKK